MTDPILKWVDEHPATMTYIAIVVTLCLILQILDVLGIA